MNIEMPVSTVIDLSQTKPGDYATMLECLSDRRVVDFNLNKERTSLNVAELCDGYFDEDLSKAQAQQMIDELQAMVDLMEG